MVQEVAGNIPYSAEISNYMRISTLLPHRIKFSCIYFYCGHVTRFEWNRKPPFFTLDRIVSLQNFLAQSISLSPLPWQSMTCELPQWKQNWQSMTKSFPNVICRWKKNNCFNGIDVMIAQYLTGTIEGRHSIERFKSWIVFFSASIVINPSFHVHIIVMWISFMIWISKCVINVDFVQNTPKENNNKIPLAQCWWNLVTKAISVVNLIRVLNEIEY